MVPGQTVSLWMWAKLKSWLWTSGRDRSGPTLLYDQWDPVERVSSSRTRCNHLRGPDLDLHTFKHRSRKPGKDCTICDQLRKFRVSPAILKTFYSGAIESVLTSASQCGMVTLQSGLQSSTESLALSWAHLRVCSPSLQDIYLKRCKSRDVKIIKDSNHPLVNSLSLITTAIWQQLPAAWCKNWETEEELLPSGHQAPKLKLGLITSTWLHLIIT